MPGALGRGPERHTPDRNTRRSARHRARRRGPRWVELSVGAAALVVSVASLAVARHQAQVMDRQLAASVWPSVQASYANVAPDVSLRVAHSLDNRGVGPARLESFRVSYRGRTVRTSGELGRACCAPDTTRGAARPRIALIEGFVAGRVLAPGEHMDWLLARFDTTGGPDERAATRRAFETVNRASPHIGVRVCYCSVLDECWVSTEDAGRRPEPVKSCDTERAAPQYR